MIKPPILSFEKMWNEHPLYSLTDLSLPALLIYLWYDSHHAELASACSWQASSYHLEDSTALHSASRPWCNVGDHSFLLCSLVDFKNFFFTLFFSNLTIMCLSVVFFVFTSLRLHCALSMCGLVFFIKFGKVSTIISVIFHQITWYCPLGY